MAEKKTYQTGIRMTESMRDAIQAIADRETRSLSQQIEHFIKQGLERYSREHPEFGPGQIPEDE